MDKYTKGVLTVIAVALVSISFQLSQTNIINEAYAKGSYSRCDNSNVRNNPCYVHIVNYEDQKNCLLYTSPSPRDCRLSRMPSSA